MIYDSVEVTKLQTMVATLRNEKEELRSSLAAEKDRADKANEDVSFLIAAETKANGRAEAAEEMARLAEIDLHSERQISAGIVDECAARVKAEAQVASLTEKLAVADEIVEAGRAVYYEVGVHPAKWIENGAGYEQRTPEMEEWNAKVMRLFTAYANLSKLSPSPVSDPANEKVVEAAQRCVRTRYDEPEVVALDAAVSALADAKLKGKGES